VIGKTLGHYQIKSQLGKGGMGEVYQAKDQKLGREPWQSRFCLKNLRGTWSGLPDSSAKPRSSPLSTTRTLQPSMDWRSPVESVSLSLNWWKGKHWPTRSMPVPSLSKNPWSLPFKLRRLSRPPTKKHHSPRPENPPTSK